MVYQEGSIGLAVAERIADMLTNAEVQCADRLWRPNAIDSIKHLLDLVQSEARDGAKSRATEEARQSISTDLFIPGVHRGGILKSLEISTEKLQPGSVPNAKLKSLCDELEDNYSSWVELYFDNFDDSVDVKSSEVDGNILSWQIAAFLRSFGMSIEWIANFFNYNLHHNEDFVSLSGTMKTAHEIILKKPGWIFFIPAEKRSSFNVTSPPLFQSREFEATFAERFPELPIPPNKGGLIIEVNTIDKYAGISEARLITQRAVDRLRASKSKRRITLEKQAWVWPGGWTTELTLDSKQNVKVRQLDADGGRHMFDRLSEEIEAALDLLTAADRTSSRAATIASWAVLETLFADDSDFGDLAIVAERAANILTCLYVKVTFGHISRGHSRSGNDELADDLRSATDSEAALLLEAALPDHPVSVSPTLGELARQRVVGLNDRQVKSLHSQLRGVFRRLYDLRNQITHAGRMEPYGLNRTYEEATVLLSALMDELLKQYRSYGRSAREVAGRADWLISRVSDKRATPASLTQLSDK